MDALTILTWAIGIQTAILIFLFGYILYSLDKTQSEVIEINGEIKVVDNGEINVVDKRLDKLEETTEKIYNLLSIIHTDNQVIKSILQMKKCCMINDRAQTKKAE